MDRSLILRAAAVASAFALAACSRDAGVASSHVAARVNGGEISIQQVHGALAQVGEAPADAQAARSRALEQVIDEELLVQRAVQRRLDRDPVVARMLESSRRQILAQAYLDTVAQAAPPGTPEEIHAFYAMNPALFARRRIYGLSQRVTQPAEALPLAILPRLAAMKEGDTTVVPSAPGETVLQLVEARDAPLSERQAAPVIEQFLRGRHRAEAGREEVRKLREQANIEYVGDFGSGRGERAADAVSPATPLKKIKATIDGRFKGIAGVHQTRKKDE